MAQRVFQTLLHKSKVRAKSNDVLYEFVSDILNAAEFGDLFSHERMLADTVRVETYAEAIRKHVASDDVVVDLGTGTGILALLAAEQGATVYAIDHSDIIEVAEQAAEHNGLTNIEFHHIHSRDFSCPEPVDMVLHEQFGDDLFDENLIENILGVKRQILRTDGAILPGRIELFLEPVTLDETYRVPHLSRMSVKGYDFDFLKDNSSLEKYRSDGYERRTLERAAFDSFLTTPEPVLSVDLDRLDGPNSLPSTINESRRVTTPGVLDGLCLYFRVIFDDELQFSTAPNQPRTHWRNRLLRTPHRYVAEGDDISYTVSMPVLEDTSRWTVEVDAT